MGYFFVRALCNFLSMSETKCLVGYVLGVVSDVTDVPVELIVGRCGVADVVDARHIAAMALWRAGLHIRQIADAMGVTRRYVQYIVTDFEARVGSRRHVRRMYELVWNHVRNGLEMMAS